MSKKHKKRGQPQQAGRAESSLLANLTPEQLAQYQTILNGGSSPDDDPPVYWGQQNEVETAAGRAPGVVIDSKTGQIEPTPGEPVLGRAGIESMEPFTIPASQALLDFDKWDNAKRQKFIDQAIKAGLLSSSAGYFEAKDLWQKLVADAVDKKAAGRNMTPWDVMSMIGGDSDVASGNKTVKRKNVTVNLLDPDSARGLIKDALANAKGRRPTQEEFDNFMSMANHYQESHPSVSVVTEKYRNGELASSHTVNKGGGDVQEAIEEEALATPEAGSFQAAGIYLPLLEQAIGAVG